MIRGLRGTLVSHDALDAAGFTSVRGCADADAAARHVARWYSGIQHQAGPTWSARLVLDRIAAPFCAALGLELTCTGTDARACQGLVRQRGTTLATVLISGWGQTPGTGWRDAVRAALPAGSRWCVCFTGPELRVFDAARTHSRRFLAFDLEHVATCRETFSVAWRLLTAPGALEAAIAVTDTHRIDVRNSLQAGVQDALQHLTSAFAAASRRRHHGTTPSLTDESLIVIYRVLFLLFAEARGLVPMWHPVFRESYSIEAMRGAIETLPRPRGVWSALQAIARLAHRGCHAGALRVAPFNGRLFSPAHAPLAESAPLEDAPVRSALLALTTRKTAAGRQRVSYADLDVEHLGGVYERLLDYEVPPSTARAHTVPPGGRRKATGTFYTPRPLTEYLVRRTLAPLVKDASPADILSLRILDPAMGSGAFLVAACRYLAAAYESALIREGSMTSFDLGEADRAAVRRLIAQRTLFGVDLNPMAVQLARLSLWLATLAGDRPLTFFDHHLRSGNTLVGAGIKDVLQQRAGQRRTREATLPLLDAAAAFDTAVAGSVTSGLAIRDGVEETLAQVRAKEALFAAMHTESDPLARWKAVADLWCAAWFDTSLRATRSTFAALIDTLAERPGRLPDTVVEGLLATARSCARNEQFFHWELEFPEVFYAPDGTARDDRGFDAILGNPPWEVLRGDAGDEDSRAEAARSGAMLTSFARGSGLYRLQASGHANLYQLFVERALMLLRRGGRLGMVLPSGFAVDHGCATLRRHLLEGTNIDSWVVVDNDERLFPIHRGLKFTLLSLTAGGATSQVPVRAGIRSAGQFETLPDGHDPDSVPVSRALIERLCGEQCAVPEVRSPLDVAIAAGAAFHLPAASSPDGWNLKFGRELNATEDRPHFNSRGGLPVVEGKQIQPFTVDAGASRNYIDISVARTLLKDAPFDRARLAYRDVASSTNRLTLIAAILPAGCVSTHTLFCLKAPLDDEAQKFVLAMFNSFVANFLVRLRVTTHVTVAIVERLPLPRPSRTSAEFRSAVALAERLLADPRDTTAMAQVQALAARLYRLDQEQFDRVLSTFPLVDERLRRAAREAFPRTI
jgi:hypothetical protein